MSDRLELTQEDRFAAADYLQVVAAQLTDDGVVGAGWALAQIDQIVLAINVLRMGDPVGTLRRDPDGVVYQRFEKDGHRYWEPLGPWPTLGMARRIHPDPEGISGWRVIYVPQESA